jgi:uncharacterized protein (TIGR03083 family)
MAAQALTTRASLQSLLNDARRQLMAAIEGLSEERLLEPLPGGWSVRDMLTHITSWEELIVLDLERVKRGRLAAGYCRGTDEWNEMLLSVRTHLPLEQVLAELAETREAALKALDEMGAGDLAHGDVAGSCQILALHDWQHTQQVREWRAKQGV